MNRAWSAAAEDKLCALYATTPLSRLAFLLKRTPTAIRSRATLLGLSKGTRRPWTRKEETVLRKRYPHERTETIAADLGRPIGPVYEHAARLGLKKSAKFLASPAAGRTNGRQGIGTRFEKGHVPANKGLRRPGWAPGRMAETQFKKGRPASAARNYVPIGTEKYDVKRKTIVRKITDDPALFPAARWKPVHVLIWEAANGPVPKGHIVRFKTGMKTLVSKDITLDRLELVTLAENMKLNSFHTNYPKEIGLAIHARAMLKRAINKRSQPNG